MERNSLHRFSAVTGVDLLSETSDGGLTAFFDSSADSPLVNDKKLREILREGASERPSPYLYKDDFDIYYAVIRYQACWLYLGPMGIVKLSDHQQRQYFRSHGVATELTHRILTFSLQEIVDLTLLASSLVVGDIWGEEDISYSESFDIPTPHSKGNEQTHFVLREEEENDENAYRHSFNDEMLLMQAVREGRPEDAVRLALSMDRDRGRLSRQEIRHWKNLAMIGVSLCARAAIEGGMTPESAYRVSGFYIQKIDEAKDVPSIIIHRNHALQELSERVAQRMHGPGITNYIFQCKDYIRKHYREKISLEAIANSLGISPTYLSHLFRKEVGMCLQDYISKIRVERAANLLVYSDKSLYEIAIYVHFPNQSYFGRMFKRYMNMTPKTYRDINKVGEYIEKSAVADNEERRS